MHTHAVQGVIIETKHINQDNSGIRGHLERFGMILAHLGGFDINLAILGFLLTIGFQCIQNSYDVFINLLITISELDNPKLSCFQLSLCVI